MSYEVMFDVTIAMGAPPVHAVRPAPQLQQIKRLQDALADLPQVDCPLKHYFGGGMYMRKCTIPAGSVVVGKMHRHAHPVLLVKGEATINTDRGMERIRAPHEWISQPGAKRALYAHTECEFVTIHLDTDGLQDPEALEAEIIIPDAQLSHENQVALSDFTDEIQRVYA
jgi:hypothetical protein